MRTHREKQSHDKYREIKKIQSKGKKKSEVKVQPEKKSNVQSQCTDVAASLEP